MAQDNTFLAVIVIVGAVLLFNYSGLFAIGLPGGVSDDGSFYQYAGHSPRTLSRDGCYEIISGVKDPSEATIRTLVSEFKFKTTNIRVMERTGGVICSAVLYDTIVYKDGKIIEEIKMTQPDKSTCEPSIASPISKTYTDGRSSIIAEFGHQRSHNIDSSNGCNTYQLIINKYKIIYPPYENPITLEKVEYKNNQAQATVSITASSHPLEGAVGMKVTAQTPFGAQEVIQEMNITIPVGKSEFLLTTPLSGEGLQFEIAPYAKLYASTSRVSEVFGAAIFDDSLEGVKWSDHPRFFIGKMDLETKKFVLINNQILGASEVQQTTQNQTAQNASSQTNITATSSTNASTQSQSSTYQTSSSGTTSVQTTTTSASSSSPSFSTVGTEGTSFFEKYGLTTTIVSFVIVLIVLLYFFLGGRK